MPNPSAFDQHATPSSRHLDCSHCPSYGRERSKPWLVAKNCCREISGCCVRQYVMVKTADTIHHEQHHSRWSSNRETNNSDFTCHGLPHIENEVAQPLLFNHTHLPVQLPDKWTNDCCFQTGCARDRVRGCCCTLHRKNPHEFSQLFFKRLCGINLTRGKYQEKRTIRHRRGVNIDEATNAVAPARDRNRLLNR